MPVPYPILQVLSDQIIGDEALGSKPKFWFQKDGQEWLFKEARENTGEDWAEKIAAEAAHALGISAASVELAEYMGRRGCASLSFVRRSEGEVLIHGNEILAGQVLGYDPGKRFGQSDHTLENIREAICKLFPEPEVHKGVLSNLAGYLVLDALIGNTDRHHENWGLKIRLRKQEGSGAVDVMLQVAPSFDHASSLGRELTDQRRAQLVQSGLVGNYVRRGHGGVFVAASDRKGANPLRLVEFGARRLADHFGPALEKVAGTGVAMLCEIVDRVPTGRMTDTSKAFTKAFLGYTHKSLCKLLN